jgi:hypothetical protein
MRYFLKLILLSEPRRLTLVVFPLHSILVEAEYLGPLGAPVAQYMA